MSSKKDLLLSTLSGKESFGIQISHSDPYRVKGGTQKLILEETRFIENTYPITCVQVCLAPIEENAPVSEQAGFSPYNYEIRIGAVLIQKLTGAEAAGLLQEAANFRKLRFIHAHHFLKWKKEDFRLVFHGITSESEVSKAYFLNDFYGLCTSVNFFYNDEIYCGAPPIGSQLCEGCSFGGIRETHFNFFLEILEKCHHVVAPSPWVKRIYSQQIPHLAHKISVSPLQTSSPREIPATSLPARTASQKIRIGFVAPESPIKGWDFWVSLCTHSELKNRYQFVQFGGKPPRVPYGVEQVEYGFSIDNPNAAVEAFDKSRVDVLLILSRVPETYSYTLFESLAARVPVLCFSVGGNVAYEVNKTQPAIGKVFTQFEELVEFLSHEASLSESLPVWRSHLQPMILEYLPPPFVRDQKAWLPQ